MRISFGKYLSKEEVKKVIFFLQQYGACIEQFPQWTQIKKDNSSTFICAYDSNNELLAFSIVNESGRLFKSAQINFGPVISKEVSYFEFISEIIHYYTEQDFCSIVIRLAEPVSSRTEILSYQLHKNYSVRELFDKDMNWTSLQVSLQPPIEDVVKSFSKGHKSAIKRARKEGLTVEIATPETLGCFAKVYCKMYYQRGKVLDDSTVQQEFLQIYEFFKQSSLGEVFVIKNKSCEIIGGIMIIFQGTQVRYFRSASDPESRSLPVLHLGIYEAMCYSKNKGMLTFDLWGYNHLVKDSDQRYHINKFKKGFSDDFVFYAKPLEIILSPGKRRVCNALLWVKTIFSKTN